MKKNIVAYSLWGTHAMYWQGALENIKLVKKYYPGWIARFYIDKDSDKNLINTIKGDNVEVILVESKGSFDGMNWRFFASCDVDVDIFLSRDCDSRITQRELDAVNQWLSSDKEFHIMRDHIYHTVPILGGMWGSRNNIMNKINFKELINNWKSYQHKGCDQDFLAQCVYPLVKNTAMEHSEFGLNYGNPIIPFPTQRENYEFVGEIYDENNIRNPEHWVLLMNK